MRDSSQFSKSRFGTRTPSTSHSSAPAVTRRKTEKRSRSSRIVVTSPFAFSSLEDRRQLGIDGERRVVGLVRFAGTEDLRPGGVGPRPRQHFVRIAGARTSSRETKLLCAVRRLPPEEGASRVARLLVFRRVDLRVERESGPKRPVDEERPADDLLHADTVFSERLLHRLPLVRGAGLLLDPVVLAREEVARHLHPELAAEDVLLRGLALHPQFEDALRVGVVEGRRGVEDEGVARLLHRPHAVDARGKRKRRRRREEEGRAPPREVPVIQPKASLSS